MSSQKRKLASTTIGYRGVQKSGKRFMSSIFVGRKLKYLGTYDNAKEAALAFDHAATQQKLPSSKLNYPNGLPIDDEDYDKIMNPINTDILVHLTPPKKQHSLLTMLSSNTNFPFPD